MTMIITLNRLHFTPFRELDQFNFLRNNSGSVPKMSRNDLILVIHDKYKKMYYVVHSRNADDDWHHNGAVCLIKKGMKFTTDRGKSLILAHNMDRKINTEYGVREVDVNTLQTK